MQYGAVYGFVYKYCQIKIMGLSFDKHCHT